MVAVAVVGSAVIGAAASSAAASKGAKAQQRSANASISEQGRQYDQTRADNAPWQQSGVNALGRLNAASTGDMSSFNASPDYNFRRTEGTRGLERTAAARGGAFSGNALRALTDFNSNLASTEYGNWWNRQAGLAGIGQSATNATTMAGQNAANNNSNALMAAGDARASGIAGQANAWSNAASSLGNYAMYRDGGYGGGGLSQYDQNMWGSGVRSNNALSQAGYGNSWRTPAMSYR
jgi:hypothetical protein